MPRTVVSLIMTRGLKYQRIVLVGRIRNIIIRQVRLLGVGNRGANNIARLYDFGDVLRIAYLDSVQS